MTFEKTKVELKRIPVIPIASYCAVILLFGFTLKELSNFGNTSYIISTVLLPTVAGTIDWFTKKHLLEALREDWIGLSAATHLLIIFDCLVMFNLVKTWITKDLWLKRIFGR